MFEIIKTETEKLLPAPDDIAQEVIKAQTTIRRHLIELLKRYDGGPSAFRYLVLDTLCRINVPQNKLAEVCLTTPGSVSRWTRGAMPVKTARIEICRRIEELLSSQIEELDRFTRSGRGDETEFEDEDGGISYERETVLLDSQFGGMANRVTTD